MDLLDPFKIGIIVLFFIPGFIFVQVIERHLLREKKPQFEKTFEIILWSAFIWIISISVHNLILGLDYQTAVLETILRSNNRVVNTKSNEYSIGPSAQNNSKKDEKISSTEEQERVTYPTATEITELATHGMIFYFIVCFFSLAFSNVWGLLRKSRILNSIGRYLTGRDWYPSVKFKFFTENIDRAIELKVDGEQYLGVLLSAPDTKEDKHIIIRAPKKLVPIAQTKS